MKHEKPPVYRNIYKRVALEDSVEAVKNTESEYRPTIQQIFFARALFSQKYQGDVTKTCRGLKMPTQLPYEWMRKPGYAAWFREEARRRLAQLSGLAHNAYVKGLKKANPYILRLYEEVGGNIGPEGGLVANKIEVIFEVNNNAIQSPAAAINGNGTADLHSE